MTIAKMVWDMELQNCSLFRSCPIMNPSWSSSVTIIRFKSGHVSQKPCTYRVSCAPWPYRKMACRYAKRQQRTLPQLPIRSCWGRDLFGHRPTCYCWINQMNKSVPSCATMMDSTVTLECRTVTFVDTHSRIWPCRHKSICHGDRNSGPATKEHLLQRSEKWSQIESEVRKGRVTKLRILPYRPTVPASWQLTKHKIFTFVQFVREVRRLQTLMHSTLLRKLNWDCTICSIRLTSISRSRITYRRHRSINCSRYWTIEWKRSYYRSITCPFSNDGTTLFIAMHHQSIRAIWSCHSHR